MSEVEQGGGRDASAAELLVPLTFNGQQVYLSVERVEAVSREVGSEDDIAWRPPSLEQALDGLMGVVRIMGDRLRDSGASKVGVEFGCEFVLESGGFAAVIGKASGKSAFKVALEWTEPDS